MSGTHATINEICSNVRTFETITLDSDYFFLFIINNKRGTELRDTELSPLYPYPLVNDLGSNCDTNSPTESQ